MKRYSYSIRGALVLIVTCLFFSAYDACPAASREAQLDRADRAGSARLIISRIPNLGNWVIVDLWVDGVPAASIGYGHTYRGSVAPGRHVLSVLPTPRPRWPTPWQMTLDVQSGRTYSFTVMDDHSGHVILEGGLDRAR
jgi:hypothetical protein